MTKVLCPTQYKTGQFGDVPHSPNQSLGLVWRKRNLTQQKHAFTNQKKCTTQNKQTLKPGLVASCDIQPGNGEGLFLFRRFINLSLTYLLRHLPTYLQSQTHTGLTTSQLALTFTTHNIQLLINQLSFRSYSRWATYPITESLGAHSTHFIYRLDALLSHTNSVKTLQHHIYPIYPTFSAENTG